MMRTLTFLACLAVSSMAYGEGCEQPQPATTTAPNPTATIQIPVVVPTVTTIPVQVQIPTVQVAPVMAMPTIYAQPYWKRGLIGRAGILPPRFIPKMRYFQGPPLVGYALTLP